MEPAFVETSSPATVRRRAWAASSGRWFVVGERPGASRPPKGPTRAATARLDRVDWRTGGDLQSRAARAADRRLATLLAELAADANATMPALLARAIVRCQDDPALLRALARAIARLSPELAAMAEPAAADDGSADRAT